MHAAIACSNTENNTCAARAYMRAWTCVRMRGEKESVKSANNAYEK